MKLLVVGGGGREHALVDKLRRDAGDAEIFAAPGNPGTALLARNVPIDVEDVQALAEFAAGEGVDLTVVGPEAPLAAGIADLFDRRGLALFGPSQVAAQLETSKAYAKRLMRDLDVPTARFEAFESVTPALAYIRELDPPIVVKASGLATGKGVLICESREEASDVAERMLSHGMFGEAGREIVVEEFLRGPELSVFFVTDGERAVPLVSARDYKRIGEGNVGPNTGGVGAFAPVPGLPTETVAEVYRSVAQPILAAMADAGAPYRGFLYVGLVLTAEGPKVLEFNCRLGDPEAQVVLALMREPIVDALLTVARGEDLGDWQPAMPDEYALCTVLVSDGYPGSYETGVPIDIPDGLESDALRVYHAGTAERDGQLVTAGGRVLGVTAVGASVADAGARSREAAGEITCPTLRWRRDIGAGL